MNRYRYLLLAILLLAILLLGCQLGGGGGGELATPTPLPPAARTGMDAINGLEAEGLQADCFTYPVWMACNPELAPIPQKELP
jgi:hypothetical protein